MAVAAILMTMWDAMIALALAIFEKKNCCNWNDPAYNAILMAAASATSSLIPTLSKASPRVERRPRRGTPTSTLLRIYTAKLT